MTVVYLDSVFLFNALLDYLLVLSAARLAGLTLRRGRYILCGLLGGAYAAAVFLPGGAFLTAAPVKAAAVKPKLMLWSMVKSVEGSIPFFFRMYSNTISGMPPVCPSMMNIFSTSRSCCREATIL